MYDVLYLDTRRRQCLIGKGLARDAACELARKEARRRKVGRMFLAGSEQSERGEIVLIVESQRHAA